MKKTYNKVIQHRDNYRDYIKGKLNKITEVEWNKYYHVIIDSIIEYIIKGGYFIMPYHLGFIRIIKNKPIYFKNKNNRLIVKKSLIDFNATKKYKKLCVHLNSHTDGYIFRIKHDINNDEIKMNAMKFFKIKINRTFKTELSKYLITNKKIPTYYEPSEYYFNYRTFTDKVTTINKY